MSDSRIESERAHADLRVDVAELSIQVGMLTDLAKTLRVILLTTLLTMLGASVTVGTYIERVDRLQAEVRAISRPRK